MKPSVASLLLVLLASLALGACGESKDDKAQKTVCSARSDIAKQVDQLKGLTVSTVTAEGVHLNAYVDDDLYVAEVTPEARAYADFQHIPLHPVGDLRTWLSQPPTKLVAVDERTRIDELEQRLKPRFAGRLYVSKSLPEFLEFASPDVNKASGLAFLADRLGFSREGTVALGDGENDVELVEWAGFGVAVANAHERVLAAADLVCPSDDEEGVAQVIEALLELRA